MYTKLVIGFLINLETNLQTEMDGICLRLLACLGNCSEEAESLLAELAETRTEMPLHAFPHAL